MDRRTDIEMAEHWRIVKPSGESVEIIDQTALPHELVIRPLRTLDEAAQAIRGMQVRGAPLIGAAAAFGIWLALRAEASDALTTRSGRSSARTGSSRSIVRAVCAAWLPEPTSSM